MSQPLNPRVLLALVGAALAPVATGISLQFLPFFGPLVLVAGVAFFFAWRADSLSWRVGVWLTGGLLASTLVVTLGLLVVKALRGGVRSVYFEGVWSFIWVTLRFTGVPALIGGCAAGWVGATIARRRRGSLRQSPIE